MNRREIPKQNFADCEGPATIPHAATSVINLVDPEPSGWRPTPHTKKRGPVVKLPEKGSAEYSGILGGAAQFALEINTNLSSGKTIWSYGMKEAARKQLSDRCLNSQFADTFKRVDSTFFSEVQISNC